MSKTKSDFDCMCLPDEPCTCGGYREDDAASVKPDPGFDVLDTAPVDGAADRADETVDEVAADRADETVGVTSVEPDDAPTEPKDARRGSRHPKIRAPRIPAAYHGLYREYQPHELPTPGDPYPERGSGDTYSLKDVYDIRTFGARDADGRPVYGQPDRFAIQTLTRFANGSGKFTMSRKQLAWYFGHDQDAHAAEKLLGLIADGVLVVVEKGYGNRFRGTATTYQIQIRTEHGPA